MMHSIIKSTLLFTCLVLCTFTTINAQLPTTPKSPFSNTQSIKTTTPSPKLYFTSDIPYSTFLLPLTSFTTPNNVSVGGSYLLALVIPSVYTINSVQLHYQPRSQKNMSHIALSAVAATPLPSSILASQGSYSTYLYSPLAIASQDHINYYFTFIYGGIPYNTSYFVYPNSNVSDSNPELLTSSPFVSASTSSFWGTYQFDNNSCRSSASCCCATGRVEVTSAGLSSAVYMDTTLDGGAGCLQLADASGVYELNSTALPVMASQTFIGTNGASAAIQASIKNDGTMIVGTTFQSCQTTGKKVGSSDFNVNAEPATPNPTTSIDSTKWRDSFIGDFEFDTSCVSSPQCCCAIGGLNIAPVLADTVLPDLPTSLTAIAAANNVDLTKYSSKQNMSHEVLLTGTMDGTSACVGLTAISQVFNVGSPNVAKFNIKPILLSATLQNIDTISFTNNMYTCPSIARRVGKSTATIANYTTPTLFAENATAVTTARANYVGLWKSDSSCVPSVSCCCASGITRISQNTSYATYVNVDTQLQGKSLACFNADGPIGLSFNILSSSTATSTSIDHVLFTADLVHVMTDHTNTLKVSNTLHPECASTLIKISDSPITSGSSSLTVMGWISAALITIALTLIMSI